MGLSSASDGWWLFDWTGYGILLTAQNVLRIPEPGKDYFGLSKEGSQTTSIGVFTWRKEEHEQTLWLHLCAAILPLVPNREK